VLRLAEIPNIVGIKESSGSLNQITELLTQAPRSFKIIAGDDGLVLPVLGLGGAGLISVASNAIPAQMAQMVGAALSGDWPAARAINRQFYRLMQAHFWEPSPAPVKAVLALMGRGEDRLRLPMTPVSALTRRKLEVLLGELGLLARAEASGEKVRMF
jgi:4-hydroxy-tetrahydrodipicolinate synthase